MAAKLTAWSYSRLACWEMCPLQAKLKFIDKIKEPDSPAMKRGADLHSSLGNFLQGKSEGVMREALQNPKIEAFIGELFHFPERIVEQQWGFDHNWKPTAWFDRGEEKVWFRSILDVGVVYDDMTGEAVDWKTGKRYGSNMDQMKSQAVAMFNKFKPLTNVTVRLVYLDEKDHKANPYEIAEIKKHEAPSIQQDFERRAAKMFADDVFRPRPNDKCHFCAFSKNKGGQCSFG